MRSTSIWKKGMIKKVESFTFGVKSLKKALKTLSLSPDAQAAYLANGGYGDYADELALEFDDAYQVIKGYFGQKLLPPQAENLIEAIHSRLDSISGPDKAEFWRTTALRDRAEWEFICDLASRALKAIHDAPITGRQ